MTRLLGFLFLIYGFVAVSQSVNVPIDRNYYHQIDRLDILSVEQEEPLYTGVKPFQRKSVAQIAENAARDSSINSKVSRTTIDYLITDNWEYVDTSYGSSKRSILNFFYKSKNDLYHHQGMDFNVHVNPVLYLSYGTESASDVNTFVNSRGAEIRGMVDEKIGFYAFLTDNQAIFPEYVHKQINGFSAIPHDNFWKNFKENGVDFFTARGYISTQATKHINVQLGYDKNFIGNGYRSLILSDYAGAYSFLKVVTRVWKINYTNLFADMTANLQTSANGGPPIDGLYPKKFMTFHHLGVNIGKHLSIGLFESVIFQRGDSLGKNAGYEMGYFNPIIFYRAIEQNFGSDDNALLGMDYKLNMAKHLSLYGQVVLDEFKLNELKDGTGWWANKYGVQTGLKYIDAFSISNLDLQVESNIVRPYTYSHGVPSTNYGHYNQPLAHPLGANFNELVGIMRVQPIPKISLTAKGFYIKTGRDTTASNWGGNIFLSNKDREQNFGNSIGQGIGSKIYLIDFTLSYMLRHNMYLELKQLVRKEDSEIDALDQSTSFTSFSLRWNIAERLHEF